MMDYYLVSQTAWIPCEDKIFIPTVRDCWLKTPDSCGEIASGAIYEPNDSLVAIKGTASYIRGYGCISEPLSLRAVD
jgi:hypothetical protein